MRLARSAFLVAALLAGCLSPGPAPARDAGLAAAVPLVIPWVLDECRYLVGWSEADPAIVQANLPEGFIVESGSPLGLPAGDTPAERAIVGTEVFDCASGTGLDAALQPMTYASIWIPVTPPDDLADPDVDLVFYKFDVLVPDAPRREAMRALGLPVGDGALAWETAAAPTGLAATATLDGVGEFRFEAVSVRTVQAPTEPTSFMEITPAGENGVDGFALWKATYAWDEATLTQARGTLDWPADHWVVDAIGSARAPATFHAGTWSFNGTITLPAR